MTLNGLQRPVSSRHTGKPIIGRQAISARLVLRGKDDLAFFDLELGLGAEIISRVPQHTGRSRLN